jgi:hypothetical protein
MITGTPSQGTLCRTVWATGSVLDVLVLELRKRPMHGALKGVMITAREVMAGVLAQAPLGTNQVSLW